MSPHIASLTLGVHERAAHRAKPGRKERKERPTRPVRKMDTNWTAALMLGPFFPG